MAVRKVHVPQDGGELTIVTGGPLGESRTWRPQGHLVSPKTEAEADLLLAQIDGARLATGADEPAPPVKAKPKPKPKDSDDHTDPTHPPSPAHDPNPEPAVMADTPS